MKRNHKIVSIFLLSCCLMLAGMGCGNDAENSTNNGTAAQKPLGGSQTNGGGSAEVSSTTTERRILADRISRAIEKVEGVEDATVLIADAADGVASSLRGGSAGSENSLNNPHASNATNETGSGKTSVTDGMVNQTSGTGNGTGSSSGSSSGGSNGSGGSYGGNPSGSNDNEGNGSSAEGTSINAAGGNGDAPYMAIVAIVPGESIQNDRMKLNALASTIRQLVLQDENSIREVIVTNDQRDIQNIGNLANNMLQDSSRDATDEINRLRDELTSAGRNLVDSGWDMVDDVADDLKELAG